jgi:hypothetical protein
MVWSAAVALLFGRGSGAGEPWRAAEQPELKQALEQAPALPVESLGESSRGVNTWQHWLVPNPDGKSWDVLQLYFKSYYESSWLYAIDLGTGEVKKQRLPDGRQFYLSGTALALDGKFYMTTPANGMFMHAYDPATNNFEDRGCIRPNIGGEVRPIVCGPDGRLYGTGSSGDNKLGLYIYDPKAGEVVKDFGLIGPSHPNGVWSGYVIGVDDTHVYLTSGMLPSWYLITVNIETGEQKVIYETPEVVRMEIVESFPGAWLLVPQHGDTPRVEDAAKEKLQREQSPDGTTTKLTAEELGWKFIHLEGVESYAMPNCPLVLMQDGRLYGTGGYDGNFIFDPQTDQTTHLGRNNGLWAYTNIACNGKVISSGYPGGPIVVFDPKLSWTVTKGGPPTHPAPWRSAPTSNPREMGGLERDTRVAIAHCSTMGADGKIYFGGCGERGYCAGGFGWYDPKTEKYGGFWKPLSGHAVFWLAPFQEGRLIAMSTRTAPDETNENRVPKEAKLFIYDVQEGRIVREIVPVPQAPGTGLIFAATPERLLGLTVDPEHADGSLLYGVDVTTGEVMFRKPLPWPVSAERERWYGCWVDSNDEYYDMVRGPDGFAWTWLRNVLVRINATDASVHVVGKIDRLGYPTFVGNDLYLSGHEQLRRIRNIVPGAPTTANGAGH